MDVLRRGPNHASDFQTSNTESHLAKRYKLKLKQSNHLVIAVGFRHRRRVQHQRWLPHIIDAVWMPRPRKIWGRPRKLLQFLKNVNKMCADSDSAFEKRNTAWKLTTHLWKSVGIDIWRAINCL